MYIYTDTYTRSSVLVSVHYTHTHDNIRVCLVNDTYKNVKYWCADLSTGLKRNKTGMKNRGEEGRRGRGGGGERG